MTHDSAEDPRAHDEPMSAAIDGECSPAEAKAVVERLLRDRDARALWSRYHTQRVALHGERVDRLEHGFAGRVSAAIAQEPPIAAPRRRLRASRWRRRVGAVAGAACVAVVTSVVVLLQSGGPGAPTVGQGEAPAEVDSGASVLHLAGETEAAVTDGQRRRIGQYLARHAEAAGVSAMPGIMPITRLSGFNARR